MNEETNVPHMTRHEQSQDKSAKSEGSGGAATGGNAEIHDRTGLYLSIIALIISAISLGMTTQLPALHAARVEVLVDRVATAEREARVMEERWNDLKVELVRRGIPVSDH